MGIIVKNTAVVVILSGLNIADGRENARVSSTSPMGR